MHRRPAYPGFTLIELLVVVSIIALLMAVLLPVLGKARATGQKAVCLSNLRQIGTFAHTYAADNHNWMFPSDFEPLASSTESLAWQNYMYVKYGWGSDKFFQCPAIDKDGQYDPASPVTAGIPSGYGTEHPEYDKLQDVSYVMNTMRPGTNGTTNWSSFVTGGLLISSAPIKSRGWTGVSSALTATNSSHYPLNMDLIRKSLSSTILILDHRPDYAPTTGGGPGVMSSNMCDGVYQFGSSDYAIDRTTTSGTPRMKVGSDPNWVHPTSFNVSFGDAHALSTKKTNPDDWVVMVDP